MTNVNIRKVENGYFVDYWIAGVARQRVFLTWDALVEWMKAQVQA